MIENTEALANELDHTVGVVGNGLFLNMISKVIVGTQMALSSLKIGFSKEEPDPQHGSLLIGIYGII